MVPIRRPFSMRHHSLAVLFLIPALTLTACGGEDETAAPADAAPVDAASADEDTASAPEDDSAAGDDEADADDANADGDDRGEPEGSFCDRLIEFLDAWGAGEVPPSELTGEYEALGAIAPGELVEPLEILAEGNDAVLAGGSVPEGYDAAGQTLATYAFEECDVSNLG